MSTNNTKNSFASKLNNLINSFDKVDNDKDYQAFTSELIELNLSDEIDIVSSQAVLKVKNELSMLIKACKRYISKQLSCKLAKSDRERYTIVKAYLNEVLKSLTYLSDNFLSQSLALEKTAVDIYEQYQKTHGFFGWSTPIKKFSDNLYEIEGFTKNARVYLIRNGNGFTYKFLAPKGQSMKCNEHFETMLEENRNTLNLAISSFLGDAKWSDLGGIILVQNAIERQIQVEKNLAMSEKIFAELN